MHAENLGAAHIDHSLYVLDNFTHYNTTCPYRNSKILHLLEI